MKPFAEWLAERFPVKRDGYDKESRRAYNRWYRQFILKPKQQAQRETSR